MHFPQSKRRKEVAMAIEQTYERAHGITLALGRPQHRAAQGAAPDAVSAAARQASPDAALDAPPDAALIAAFDAALERLAASNVIPRLWARDPTLWPGDRAEIANRLGWLGWLGWLRDSDAARRTIPTLVELARSARGRGLVSAAVIGMGGSSLAPEVYGRALGTAAGLAPTILDSTHPDAVRAADAALDPLRTLFVVSSKSGTTIETTWLARHCLARVAAALEAAGSDEPPGGRFVAITDPGSALSAWAQREGFCAVFDGPADVGGRFSALTPFGLVPAALFGVDLAPVLDAASRMAQACGRPMDMRAAEAAVAEDSPAARTDAPESAARAAANERNPAALLGAALAGMAAVGRSALTLVVAQPLQPLGDWIEQLVAESTGKGGLGILPVVGEPVAEPGACGTDRFFVHVRMAGDGSADAALARLEASGHPVATLDVADAADLGGQFILWMLATAVAGHLLGVQPFDQPDVEAAKRRARQLLAAEGDGAGDAGGGAPSYEGGRDAGGGAPSRVGRRGDGPGGPWQPAEPARLAAFLDGPCDYVAVLAWLARTPATDEALAALRRAIGARTGRPVTVGYGPRYLHSTGQLHKGDAGRGRFLALIDASEADVAAPGGAEGETFGRLMRAQAAGDLAALADAGRAVLGLRLVGSPAEGIAWLAAGLG